MTIKVVDTAPEGFQSFTRGCFYSAESAMRRAKVRAKYTEATIYVVAQAANRLYDAVWYVGRVV